MTVYRTTNCTYRLPTVLGNNGNQESCATSTKRIETGHHEEKEFLFFRDSVWRRIMMTFIHLHTESQKIKILFLKKPSFNLFSARCTRLSNSM